MNRAQGYWSTDERVDSYIAQNKEMDEDTDIGPYTLLQLMKEVLRKEKSYTTNTLLDIGCGPGTMSISFIEEFGCKKFFALDLSDVMLGNVPWYIDIEKIKTTFQRLDISTEPFVTPANSVDLAISLRTFLYIENIENVFKETSRSLRSGGLFGFTYLTHKRKVDTSQFCEKAEFRMDMYAQSKPRLDRYIQENGFEVIAKHFINVHKDLTNGDVNHGILLLRKI